MIFCISSCKKAEQTEAQTDPSGTSVPMEFAEGLRITDFEHYTLLEVAQPWQGAEKKLKYILTDKATKLDPLLILGVNALIENPIKKIVVTSTTHIPALELLGLEETLVGFPQTQYISSPKTRQRIAEGLLEDLGTNEGLNTEVLLNLNPDLIVGFGVDGSNKAFDQLQRAGIPVLYNGDWLETSPLGKAEWIKFFGVLLDKREESDSIFNTIKNNYLQAKKLALTATKKPKVLSGALYRDVWYLPSGNSTEAQLMRDAQMDYLWKETEGSGSLALSFESVFEKGKTAEIWLNPSNLNSYKSMNEANLQYQNFRAFQKKSIYTIANTLGETGGVLYYELGTTRPDWILKDLIQLAHPELLPDYTPHFFKPMP